MKNRNLIYSVVALFCIWLAATLYLWPSALGGKVMLPFDILRSVSPWNYGHAAAASYNSLLSDAVFLYYPWRTFLANAFIHSFVPLWNPYIFSGAPFLANSQAAATYPLNILFGIFSVSRAYTIQIILHITLAGGFMFMYLRLLKASRMSSLLSAFTFMFCGFFVAWMEFATFLSTGIWLPLIFYFTEKTIRTFKPVYAILTGASLCLMFLGGHIQIAYFAILAWAFYLVWRTVPTVYKASDWRRTALKAGALIILAGIVFGGLAAVQLLPTFEFSNQIVRAKEPYEGLVAAALPVQNLATLVFPDLFGNQVNGNFAGLGNYTEYCLYIGVLPLLLGFLALFLKKDKYAAFFLILAGGSLLLALGTPLYRLFYEFVPKLDQIRAIQRFVYLFDFSIAVLAGLTLENLRKLAEDNDFAAVKTNLKRFLTSQWIVVAALIPVALLLIRFHYGVGIISGLEYLLTAVGRKYLALSVFKGILFYTASIGLLYLLAFRKMRWPSFAVACLTLALVDLFIFGAKYNTHYELQEFNPRTETTAFLRKNQGYSRIIRAGDGSAIPANLCLPYSIFDTQGSDTFIYTRYVEFLSLIEDQKANAYWNNLANLKQPESLDSKLLDVLNVKYVVSLTPVKTDLPLAYKGEAYIYRNTNVLPRAFLVTSAETITNKRNLLRKLGEPSFNPGKTVLLEEAAPALAKAGSGTAKKPGTAVITSYRNESIKIKTDAPGKTFLFLSELYYPGWNVYVDNKQAKIFRADYVFRSVFLEPGRHTVVFKYEPESYRLGLVISAATLVAVLALLAILIVLSWRKGKA